MMVGRVGRAGGEEGSTALPTVPSPAEREARTGANLQKMNRMGDRELRRMAAFKLRQVARQLAELERCSAQEATRVELVAVRRVLTAAAEDLQDEAAVVVEGDDEAHMAIR